MVVKMPFGHSRYKTIRVDKVEYSGVFDFQGLYSLIRQFYMERRYIFTENNMKYKRSRFGWHYEIDMQGWRKATSYVKYWIKLYIRIWDLEEVEVIKDGKKQKMWRGRLFVEINPYIETDYQNRFDKSPFWQKFRDWMNNYVLKREIEFEHWDHLYYVAKNFRDELKKFLNMSAV